ncbi:helix-turn-helix domain-containing protein [Pedobacter aquatilis]|uniref:helix-turn-helix domain-containing protein n=1 Tax=Pedobacter aquatilis TaxID=351343 RepID=UPI00292D42C4|nr:helix-turn-helix domain-containing protein [Pedobacter aquatilis]
MNLTEIVTKQDIEDLKTLIIEEIRKLRHGVKKTPLNKEWLKSYEVIKLLSISPNTLAALRKKGAIRFSKVGGLMYYRHSDIELLMQG